MTKIASFLFENRILAVMLFIAIIIGGLKSWGQLDLEAYPDVADTEVTIITQVFGLPAEEMELQISVPIERELNAVPGAISRRSRNIPGLSIIQITFDENTDIYKARQFVTEKLSTIQLPNGVVPVLGPLTTSIGEIFRYVVEGPPDVSVKYLRELQDYVIIPKILQATGVVDIANFGGLVKEYHIIIDPLKLEKFSISIQEIEISIQSNNKNTGGNFIVTGASQLNIRAVGRISTISDLENIVISNRPGSPILLKDLATVEDGNLPPSGILGYFDRSRSESRERGVEGIILLRKYENPTNTVISIKEKIKELNQSILPKDIQIYPVYDRTELVGLTVETVASTLSEGTVVVFLVLTFLLGSWRPALLSALAIPFSLSFAFIIMFATGTAANLLSLGAIDFGIIVDGTVVVVESIFRKLSSDNHKIPHAAINSKLEHSSSDKGTNLKDGNNFRLKIWEGSSSVRERVVFSVFLIVLSLFPILTMTRVEGRLFAPMAWTLSFAISGSVIYAIFFSPTIALFLLKDEPEKENRFWKATEIIYSKLLNKAFTKPKKTLALGALLTAICYSCVFFVGSEFLPELDEGSIWLRVKLPVGISLQAAVEYPKKIREELFKYPEIKTVVSQLGRNDDGTDPYGPNRIEFLLTLKQPYSSWESKFTKQELTRKIRDDMEIILPGAIISLSQPILDNTTEAATGSSADLAIILLGRDLNELRKIGKNVLKIVRSIPGNSESSLEQEEPQPQIVIHINREKAARFGINVEDVDTLLETAISGNPIGSLYEEERKFNIVLRYSNENRNSIEALGKILVSGSGSKGIKVSLSSIADIQYENGETIIARTNGNRTIAVRTNIRGRDQGGFAEDLEKAIEKSKVIPSSISYTMGGQFENMKRSQSRLILIIPFTLFLLFISLLIYFKNDIISAILVSTNIPYAVLGGYLGLLFRGMHFSISAGVGFVSLLGISVMSGVLLVDYLNIQVKERNESKDKIWNISIFLELVKEGSRVQFRPRFLVMLIAILGLIPATLNTGVGSDV